MQEFNTLRVSIGTIRNRKGLTKNIPRAKTYERKDGSSEVKNYIQTVYVKNQPKVYEYKALRKNMRELLRKVSNDAVLKMVEILLENDELEQLIKDSDKKEVESELEDKTTTVDMEEEDAIVEPDSVVVVDLSNVVESEVVESEVVESEVDVMASPSGSDTEPKKEVKKRTIKRTVRQELNDFKKKQEGEDVPVKKKPIKKPIKKVSMPLKKGERKKQEEEKKE